MDVLDEGLVPDSQFLECAESNEQRAIFSTPYPFPGTVLIAPEPPVNSQVFWTSPTPLCLGLISQSNPYAAHLPGS